MDTQSVISGESGGRGTERNAVSMLFLCAAETVAERVNPMAGREEQSYRSYKRSSSRLPDVPGLCLWFCSEPTLDLTAVL